MHPATARRLPGACLGLRSADQWRTDVVFWYVMQGNATQQSSADAAQHDLNAACTASGGTLTAGQGAGHIGVAERVDDQAPLPQLSWN